MTDAGSAADGPPPILETAELADRLAAASGLLLALDFDGTLAAVVDDPDDPELAAGNRRALRQLADARGVRVAVVSGRALSDLRERVGVEGITYAGNHGLELRRDGATTVRPAAEQCRPVLRELVAAFEDRLADVDGCIVEDKGLTATVHYRQVAADRVDEVRRAVRSTVSERASDAVRVQSGKAVLELRPAVSQDKGTVVRRLAEEVGSGLTVYLGDDSTDEDAFEVLAERDGGLGIHVGDDPATVAERRLPDPAAVERFLAWLADWAGGETDRGAAGKSPDFSQ